MEPLDRRATPTDVARGLPAELLVVEDSPSDLRLLLEALADLGVAPSGIRTAGTLHEARAALAAGPVDGILLDLSLPDAVGLEAVAVLASAAPDAPIVVVTGLPGADSLVYAALAEGAEEHLSMADLTGDRLGGTLCRAVERRRSRRAGGTGRMVFDSIEAPTVALDGTGRIIETNRAWRGAARRGGASEGTTGVGVSYTSVCDMAAGIGAEGAAEVAAGIRAVLHGEAERFSMDYLCPSEGVDHWYSLRVAPLGEVGGGAVVTHLEITPLKEAELALQRDELRLHAVFDQSSPIFALLDRDGVVVHIADVTCRVLGFAAGSVVGRPVTTHLDPFDVGDAQLALAQLLTTPGARARLDVTVVDGGGRRRQLQLVLANLLDDPNVGAIAVTGSDVTGSRRAQIARRLEARLLERLPASVIVTDDRGVVVYWNDRATTIFGHTAAGAIGRPVDELGILPTARDQRRALTAAADGGGWWEGGYDARRADGSTVPIYTTVEQVDDPEIGFRGFVGAAVDVSVQRRLEADLAFQVLHDPLTALPNRRMLVDRLEGAVARAARRDALAVVALLDIDDFKGINDDLGHEAGDEVLRAVACLLGSLTRAGELVARLGGDEFVLCCEDVGSVADAWAVAERMQEVLRAPFRAGGRTFTVSTSVGLAVSGPSTHGGSLLRNADAAMHVAKEAGRGRIELFDDARHQRARHHQARARDLERALADGELVTWFQPEVDLASGELFGFEALVRWRHPTRGIVAPAEFIGLAEETGMVGRLGQQVLGDACRALAALLAEAPAHRLVMSVNVSAHQLGDPGLPATVRAAIDEAGIPADRLCLEVTESALMDVGDGAEALRALRAIGVAIAIDDFGTGYSSLSRLRHFPVDFLKIDRSFITGLGTEPGGDVIVTAVVGLARSLGLRCIAEGIEDVEQLARLRALGCEFGQGYLWSRPVPFAEAAALAGPYAGTALPSAAVRAGRFLPIRAR